MATSAFKSTTKRTSVGKGADDSSSGTSASSSSNNRAIRRSRSLSRFSRRLLDTETETDGPDYIKNAPRGKFVNTERGSKVPEISLDDLALEFFSSPNEEKVRESIQPREGRSTRRSSDVGRWASDTASSRTRGRSVSRHRNTPTGAAGAGGVNGKNVIADNSSGKSSTKVVNSDAHSRRRRSLSVARYHISDSESDVDLSRNFGTRSNTKNLNGLGGQISTPLNVAATPNNRRLGRSLSQKDFSLLHDGYSSQSSALTDDDIKDAFINKYGTEKTIRAVYAQKKVERPVEDGRNGLYEARGGKNSTLPASDYLKEDKTNAHQNISVMKQNYATKLEQSEKRKQDLLDEIILEEQRGRELSKIVREIVSSSPVAQRPARTRKRSKDQNRMSSELVEEAEKYFEDFISNIEDTDFSSFDGERSDTSSTLGGSIKAKDHEVKLHPVESDGINLPWLKWETSSDASLITKNKINPLVTPKALKWDTEQEMNKDPSSHCHSMSSQGSWSPGIFTVHKSESKLREFGNHERSGFDMEEYHKFQKEEELLFERYNQRNRIDSGGLLLCTHVL